MGSRGETQTLPRRVLHVTKASGISGSENHLLGLLPGLREQGFDVRLLLLHEGEPGAQAFVDALRACGVPVEGQRIAHAADPRGFLAVLRAARRLRPVLLHTHLVHADFHGLPAGRLARVPVLASTKHGFNAFRSSRTFAAADRAVGGLADLHITISSGLARYLAVEEGFREDGFEVVHYGIEPGPEPPPLPAAPRLAVVGRLIPIKGLETLLDALALLDRPGVEVEFAGEGPLREALEARTAALGLSGRVRFLGRVAPPTAVFERAIAVVVPSLGEGFGMVALEAMERGRAVVASAVGGLPEIVRDGETGLVVPPGDPGALAEALGRIVDDPARTAAMGRAGRVRALAEFAQSRCVERTAVLYERALARGRIRS